jgi:hypothetical protein
MLMTNVKNLGVIIEPIKPEDWVVGASGIDFKSNVADGNWRKWLPIGELQYNEAIDFMNCVTQAAINKIEVQINYKLAKGLLRAEQKSFLYDNDYIKDGKVHFSKRHIAKLSNTSKKGNTFGRVANAIKKFGLIPEELWIPTKKMTWDEYYCDVPQNLIDLGKKFLELFYFQYEILVSPLRPSTKEEAKKVMSKHITQAPLEIFTKTCKGWRTEDIVPACTGTINHATMVYAIIWKQYFSDFDHYKPFEKKLAWDYNIPYAFKIIIRQRNLDEAKIKPAKIKVKQIMANRIIPYFWRPNLHGEAYEVFADGSFKYVKGIPCPLFASFIRNKLLVGMPEDLWKEIKYAEER